MAGNYVVCAPIMCMGRASECYMRCVRVVYRCCTCTMPPAPSEDDAARLWNDREGMGFEQKGRGNA
jgi:hypothetical protein